MHREEGVSLSPGVGEGQEETLLELWGVAKGGYSREMYQLWPLSSELTSGGAEAQTPSRSVSPGLLQKGPSHQLDANNDPCQCPLCSRRGQPESGSGREHTAVLAKGQGGPSPLRHAHNRECVPL